MYGVLPDSLDSRDSHTQSDTLSNITVTFVVKCFKGDGDTYKRISDLANNVTRQTQRNSLDLGPPDAEYHEIDTLLDDAIDLAPMLSGEQSIEKQPPEITYANGFDLDPNVIEACDKSKTEFTNQILDHYLSAQAAMLTGNETAIAYAQATMRDHYGIDVTIDDNLTPILEDVFLLAQANLSVKGAKLPEAISEIYLSKLADVLATNTPAKLKSHNAAKAAREHIRKHKSELDNASVNPSSHLGTSRRGR